MKYVYPAIFEDDDGKIGGSVPDIPGCLVLLGIVLLVLAMGWLGFLFLCSLWCRF